MEAIWPSNPRFGTVRYGSYWFRLLTKRRFILARNMRRRVRRRIISFRRGRTAIGWAAIEARPSALRLRCRRRRSIGHEHEQQRIKELMSCAAFSLWPTHTFSSSASQQPQPRPTTPSSSSPRPFRHCRPTRSFRPSRLCRTNRQIRPRTALICLSLRCATA